MSIMYTQRTLSQTLLQASLSFPVVLVTGPRQVGKTTLLRANATPERHYVTLDDLEQRELANTDPALFFQINKPPLIIDEIQYAPKLFGTIKLLADRLQQPGLFWLTGSQKFHLMKGVSESLAGRIAILDLLGFSQAEEAQRVDQVKPFLPTASWLENARQYAGPAKDVRSIFQTIWRGSYPKLITDPQLSRDLFYNAYLQTYLQRDVRDLTQVGNENTFRRFIRASAARTGQLLNYADLARDVDIDQKTAKAWLSILETSGLVYLLQPYHSNLTKRLVKTPKLYFLDTGLCTFITQWSSPEALEAGAMSGAILETWVVTEILKSYWHNGRTPHLYFYRDRDQKEIDLIIESDDTLYPIEIKKTASPSQNAARSFPAIEKLGRKAGQGAVLCLRETDIPLSREVTAIPLGYL
jgi:uncharacterized protein